MHSGKPQKQALAIAYSVKKRAKMAKGGVMYQCPDCLSQQSKCALHANAKPEGHLDNERMEPQHMKFANRSEEPGISEDSSGSPTMDRAVRAQHEMSIPDRLMQKRKPRGSSVGRYADGGPVMKDEPESPRPDESIEPFSLGRVIDPIDENPAMRDEDRDARHMASGGYLDPNKPQSIESQRPPSMPEGMDKSKELDKVHPNLGGSQRYSDSSEDDINIGHDYSLLPSMDASTTSERHDADETDDAQQQSLVGQLMAKRRKMKRQSSVHCNHKGYTMTLKELEALLKLCRKHGVSGLKQGDLELTLTEHAPVELKRDRSKKNASEPTSDMIEEGTWDSLSDEEKLMWSSVPAAEND